MFGVMLMLVIQASPVLGPPSFRFGICNLQLLRNKLLLRIIALTTRSLLLWCGDYFSGTDATLSHLCSKEPKTERWSS